MKAGTLDRRILVQRPVAIRDSVGAEINGWVDVANPWASFERTGGDEEFRASQRSHEQQVMFQIRYRPGIDAKMRVVYDGEPYEIVDVAEIGRREGLLLTATVREVTSGA